MQSVTGHVRPSYGPLIPTCAAYGIKRTRAYEYAANGLLETFLISGRRFVRIESLETLPERIAAAESKGAC